MDGFQPLPRILFHQSWEEDFYCLTHNFHFFDLFQLRGMYGTDMMGSRTVPVHTPGEFLSSTLTPLEQTVFS